MRRAVPIVLAAGALVAPACGGSPVAAEGEADLANGKQKYIQLCGGCHALEEAGARGVVGPDLDDVYLELRLTGWHPSSFEAFVRQQISDPSPPMPPDLAEGKDASDIAAYVAAVAAVRAAKASELQADRAD